MYCPNPDCPDLPKRRVPTEFTDTVSVCPACGVALVASMPSWVNPSTGGTAFLPCMTVGNAGLLPQIKGVLDSAELRYFVKNEGLQSLMGWGTVGLGYNNVFGPPVIMVDPAEFDAARALLKRFEEPAATARRSAAAAGKVRTQARLRCSRCDKEIEADSDDEPLTYCYYCGWPLETA